MTEILLGVAYRDVISNFEGVAVGHVVYLTGCNQTLLQPKGTDPSKRPSAEWYDDQRLQRVDESEAPIALDNGDTPGCDAPAPLR